MLLPNLQKYVVVTRSFQFIGNAEKRLINSIENGCIFDNARIGHPNQLNFYGLPYGEKINTKFIDFQNVEVKASLDLATVNIPLEQIYFFFDLKSMESSGNNPEKLQVEKQFSLETINIRFGDLGGLTLQGETYLHKGALVNGVIRILLKEEEWFIMQHPRIVGENAEKFDDLFGFESLCKQNDCEFDHIMVKADKVVAFRQDAFEIDGEFFE